MKENKSKSVHVTFTLNRQMCLPVKLNSKQLPQADEVKISLYTSGQTPHLDKTHPYKKKTTRPQTTKPVLANLSQITVMPLQQAPGFQSYT
jgi:hypothetical protein